MFLVPSVVYLRHKIDAQGLHLVVEKVEAVKKAPTPRNMTELKSYLGHLSGILLSFPSQPLNIVGTFILAVEMQPILVLERRTRKGIHQVQRVVDIVSYN